MLLLIHSIGVLEVQHWAIGYWALTTTWYCAIGVWVFYGIALHSTPLGVGDSLPFAGIAVVIHHNTILIHMSWHRSRDAWRRNMCFSCLPMPRPHVHSCCLADCSFLLAIVLSFALWSDEVVCPLHLCSLGYQPAILVVGSRPLIVSVLLRWSWLLPSKYPPIMFIYS